MPKLPILRLRSSEPPSLPDLRYYLPVLTFSSLQLGVDNLRYDVFLSPRIMADLSLHLARFLCRFGGVEALLEMDVPNTIPASPSKFIRPAAETNTRKADPTNLKTSLLAIHHAILARAKFEGNPSIDLIGRLAVVKFIRSELQAQFSRILEQCRRKLKALEGVRQNALLQAQECVTTFHVHKKIIIRRAGQEVFAQLRDIERETLARTRTSLLGEVQADIYRLFLNPLIFTEDGRDDYLRAQHYYMFGNFEKDQDRFPDLRQSALRFLRELGYGEDIDDDHLEQALNVPENALALVGTGNGEDATAEDRNRKERLDVWTHQLQRESVLQHVVASYEAVPLLADYAPRVNPQQLKHALIHREEAERVQKIIEEGRLQSERLKAAIERVSSCRWTERSRFAARVLYDMFCYHRDIRGLETVNAGFDSINLVTEGKVRELSALNGILYEFLPPEEQKPAEERVVDHVILKADVRDSSRLTRSLMAKGMNAASYFSLNFYDPVNKLIAAYGATKVFVEGDAIIVAMLERDSDVRLGVGRACVLAWEIVSLLHGYNELLRRSGLPPMEVGLGISYQNSPPLYLVDGEHRIMISDAINESDRLSSCNKRVRKRVADEAGSFRVYTLQIGGDQEDAVGELAAGAGKGAAIGGGGNSGGGSVSECVGASVNEDLRLNYNVGGICLSEAAFHKLRQEISLNQWQADLNRPGFDVPWVDREGEFFVGTVPVGNGIFRRIAIRTSRVAEVDIRDLSIRHWTDRRYYEICADPAVYAALPGEKSAATEKS
jgi:class 3 adenylate cyclase